MLRYLALALLAGSASVSLGQGCISTATIPPPATAPFSGLTGAGVYVINPEPANFSTFGCFGLGNPILRVTDGSTATAACAAQGTTCPTKADRSFVVNASDGEDNQWSVDDSQFSIVDSGNTAYIFDFHGITNTATLRYSNVNNVVKMGGFPTASHVTPKLFYSLANSAGSGVGTVLSSYDTSQTWPTLPTRTTIYDFSSSVNGVPASASHPTDSVAANYTDTKFGSGFSTSGSQGTGVYVASYLIGSGVSVWKTDASTVTGDYGSTGAMICQNCPGGVTDPGHFTIHNVKWSRDLKYALVAVQGSCLTTCYNGSSPYLWQTGTTSVWTFCGSNCSGHWVAGNLTFINQYNNPTYIQKPYGSQTGTSFPPDPNCTDSVTLPFDHHASWWNNDATDTQPFFVSTTANAHNPVYNGCNVAEIDAFDPPTIGDNKVFRFGHNYTYATSEFAPQNGLGTISPDGKYFLYTSPMGSSSNMGQLGDTGGNYPCTVAANCRGDVFVLQLLCINFCLGGVPTISRSGVML